MSAVRGGGGLELVGTIIIFEINVSSLVEMSFLKILFVLGAVLR